MSGNINLGELFESNSNIEEDSSEDMYNGMSHEITQDDINPGE